jgi:hypothetical protein
MAIDLDFDELAERTIQSQYGTSPHIRGIIERFAKLIAPTADIETFYEKIFDPRTAEGVGLDIWGIIVGANRYVEVQGEDYFGFLGSNLHPFNQRPFYQDGGASNVYRMADNAFRELIFLKAYANIGDATMPSIKRIVNAIFPKGGTAIKAGHMKIRMIFFSFEVPPYSFALLRKYGLFNVGAGVGWEYYVLDPTETFGFNGSGMQPFNQGIFAPYDIVDGE